MASEDRISIKEFKKILNRDNFSKEASEDRDNCSNSGRRRFIKKVGGGLVSLGAFSLLSSATAFNIRTSNALNYFSDDQENPEFSVNQTGSITANSLSVNNSYFSEVYSKVANGCVLGSHEDFSAAQEALDFANSNGYYTILFTEGDYSGIQPYSNQKIIGLGGDVVFNGGTTSHGINISNAARVEINGVKPRTEPGAGNDYDAIHIASYSNKVLNCIINESDRYGVYVGANNTKRYNKIQHNHFGNGCDNESVFLSSNSDRTCVIGNTGGAGFSTTDNGSKNVVNSNAN